MLLYRKREEIRIKICRLISAVLCAALLLTLSACAGGAGSSTPVSSDPSQKGEISMMCGLFSSSFFEKYAPFWKACGIKTLQFWVRDMDKSSSDETLTTYLQNIQGQIRAAHEMGFQVYLGFLSNFSLPEEGKFWYNSHFDVTDEEEMQKRLNVLAKTVEATPEADGYSIFCGDPGGYVFLNGRQSDVSNYVYLCRQFIEVIRRYRPEVPVNVTPWSIASFQTPYIGPDSTVFWDRETDMTRRLVELDDLIGADLGIEFPCHNYYRPLALRLYEAKNITPPLYPAAEDLTALEQRGCTRRWAWPYFIMDECDDGDGAGVGVQINVRYWYQLLQQLRDAGINGVFGNWSAGGHYDHAVNMYAFGRFCADPTVTPEQVIEEYAAKNVAPADVPALTQALCYLENHANWHNKMPARYQLEPMPAPATAAQALALLEDVQPLAEGDGTAEAPADFLTRVRQSLTALAEKGR